MIIKIRIHLLREWNENMSNTSTRVLLVDDEGKMRQLFSISYEGRADDKCVRIYLGGHYREARFFRKGSKDIDAVAGDVHSAHISYHSSGNIHLSCYARNGVKIHDSVGRATLNLPLEKLSPGMEFMKIIPFKISRFPLHNKKIRPTDLVLQDFAQIPEYIIGHPIEIGFWIGHGDVLEIEEKAHAIRNFEILRIQRQAEVYPLQTEDVPMHLFIVVKRPRELDKFPDRTTVTVFSSNDHGTGYLAQK